MLAVIASVVGGQAGALVGLAQNGAAADSGLFRLTIGTMGATTVMVVLAATHGLLRDLFAARRQA